MWVSFLGRHGKCHTEDLLNALALGRRGRATRSLALGARVEHHAAMVNALLASRLGGRSATPWRLLAVSALGTAAAALCIAAAAPARTVQRPDLLRYFADAATTGTMVVRHAGRRPQTVVVGARRSHTRFLPSSTFKIPNSLLAIDRGVASGPSQPYPGPNPNFLVAGKPFLPAACEGDLTLATAFGFSCIPIYQRIAHQLGRAVYARAVRAMDYGNRRVDGAPLDSFWLEGPFAISAHEQVRFIERLRRGTLPVSRRAMRDVRSMMILERDAGVVLRGKTGYVFSTSPHVGWWVGWVASGADSWTFALNLDITRPEHAAARVAIGRAILGELGALAPATPRGRVG
jgi:beta-lactamase class D